MICTSLKKSIFLKLYVTDKMQCNTFTHGSKFIAEHIQFSHLPMGGGFLNVRMASYWL